MIVATRKPLMDSGYRNILRKVRAGTVLYFPGLPEGMSKATIPDYSGKGNHGTITGAIVERLPSGVLYLDFDGTDDQVDCGTSATLNMSTSDCSMLAWIYCEGYANYPAIYGGLTGAAEFGIWNTGKLYLSKVATADSPTSTTAITLNKWQLAAVVFDSVAVTNNCQFYLDGADDGLVTFNQNFAAVTEWIGGSFTGGLSRDFAGNMALWRILTGVKLTAAQVKDSYKREYPLFVP